MDLDFSATLPSVDAYESEVDRGSSSSSSSSSTRRRRGRRTHAGEEDIDIPRPSKHAKQTRPAIQRPTKEDFTAAVDRHERLLHVKHNIIGTTAYERHQQFVSDFLRWYGGRREDIEFTPKIRNDYDVLEEENRFVWTKEDESKDLTEGQKMAKAFYDKLFKEYALVNLSRYKTGKVGMRWRTGDEVVLGKGQFQCGAIGCRVRENLASWEVLFRYIERGEERSELVKVRLCRKCSKRLNYKHKHRSASPAPTPHEPRGKQQENRQRAGDVSLESNNHSEEDTKTSTATTS